MKIYWSYKHLPELKALEPEAAKKLYVKHSGRNQGLFAVFIIFLVAGALLILFGESRWYSYLYTLPLFLAWGITSALITIMIRLHLIRRFLRKDLPEFCAGCGYCIVGLKDSRCPECGKEFDPTLPRSQERAEAIMRGEIK